ncbi:alpha/beta hydrolase [Caballeronia sp. LZ065]|uniref:alpha/beta fold hydrolase n=1 Tax=Caballeronia sp. LZ065 TaxID=3038571 RepID=UPI0028543747|nr:alpha/beta hydrolase [Caballeronia sp. LZ065]MDR5781051.1 alpha/beta hydrolase [Caballeronia sp. LZ065]
MKTSTPSDSSAASRPVNFVLIHGAWHGGWVWRTVADDLNARGHRAIAPTLTGLGERRHLIASATSLDVNVDDIVNVIEAEELRDVVLVGHSYGGLVASGVADRVPHALRSLIFLDSLLVENGQTAFDVLPASVIEERMESVRTSGQSLGMPVNGLKGTGIPEDHPCAAWVRRRLTPHPLSTYTTPLRLDHPLGNGLPCTYVHCANPSYDTLAGVRERVRSRSGWQWESIDTGHDAMVLAPELLTDLLERLAVAK